MGPARGQERGPCGWRVADKVRSVAILDQTFNPRFPIELTKSTGYFPKPFSSSTGTVRVAPNAAQKEQLRHRLHGAMPLLQQALSSGLLMIRSSMSIRTDLVTAATEGLDTSFSSLALGTFLAQSPLALSSF